MYSHFMSLNNGDYNERPIIDGLNRLKSAWEVGPVSFLVEGVLLGMIQTLAATVAINSGVAGGFLVKGSLDSLPEEYQLPNGMEDLASILAGFFVAALAARHMFWTKTSQWTHH